MVGRLLWLLLLLLLLERVNWLHRHSMKPQLAYNRMQLPLEHEGAARCLIDPRTVPAHW